MLCDRIGTMKFTEEDLMNLSRLARIDISDDEKAKMLLDMQAILGYVSEINEAVSRSVEGNEAVYNVVREDVVTTHPGSKTVSLLREAPKVEGNYVEVLQVLK